MKRLIALLLVICLFIPLTACSEEKEEKKGIEDILFLGDDLMETSKVYEYFNELCTLNKKKITVHHRAIEDARMYSYAALCEEDEEFRSLVENADVILFQEGSAETKTTVESVTSILEYANDPLVVCISYYGYPRWMHRNIFLNSHPDFRYADSNTVIGSIIALDDAPLGFEHLYQEDYIHPNELNGFIVALICYSKVYGTKPESILWQGIEEKQSLILGTPCSNTAELEKLLSELQTGVNKYIN